MGQLSGFSDPSRSQLHHLPIVVRRELLLAFVIDPLKQLVHPPM